MRKSLLTLIAVATFALILAGCGSQSPVSMQVQDLDAKSPRFFTDSSSNAVVGSMNGGCADTIVTIFAGQTIDAGTVTVSNDATDLHVLVTATNGWLLEEVHLFAGTGMPPTTKKGNPIPGQFPYKQTFEPPEDSATFTISLADLGVDCDDSLNIAVHAAMVKLDGGGNVIQSETGWADGEPFPGARNWATFFTYTICCDNGGGNGDEECETAFAKGPDADTTCFLDLDIDANRWGWTTGPLSEGIYSFPIYAGAGQCDVSKGTQVGLLTVVYKLGSASVTFTVAGFTLEETHLYVGSEILPRDKKGDFTVAPGQYPDIHENLGGASSDYFSVGGLSGDIYIVAHAVVCGQF